MSGPQKTWAWLSSSLSNGAGEQGTMGVSIKVKPEDCFLETLDMEAGTEVLPEAGSSWCLLQASEVSLHPLCYHPCPSHCFKPVVGIFPRKSSSMSLI